MDHLRRELAPISDAAWAAINDEASATLKHFLTARPLIDVSGPHGWELSCRNLGLVEPLAEAPGEGVQALARRVQTLVELRVPFTLSRAELDGIDRGNTRPDLDPVIEACRRIARAEDHMVFYGYPAAGIRGIAESSPHAPVPIEDDYNRYPSAVARAVAELRERGVEGPFGIALGPRCFTGVIETTEHGGYPVLEHIKMILGGPLYWAPSVDGAVVVSLRGGDYELVLGQDLSIGYLDHDASSVTLYVEESVTFLVHDERAGVALVYR